jgi:malate dehydrogenase (oxaloacetate-decarboxylating)(NADP+)
MTVLAAEEIPGSASSRRPPCCRMSNFGSRDTASSRKMREATRLIWTATIRTCEVDGEMHRLRARARCASGSMPNGKLTGEANLLVFPNLDAANIAHNA